MPIAAQMKTLNQKKSPSLKKLKRQMISRLKMRS
jgi:hypothetical protein